MSTDGNPPPVIVDIVPDDPNHPPGWDPQPGPETGLLNLPPGARDWVSTRENAMLGAHWRVRAGTNSSVGIIWSDSTSVLRFGALTELEILPPEEIARKHDSVTGRFLAKALAGATN